MSTDPNRFLHVLVFGAILLPIVYIPYIPIRRHLLGLRRSIHTLSGNTTFLQRELSDALKTAQLRREETLKLADQIHGLRAQFDAVTKRVAEYETARLISERDVTERLRTVLGRAAEAENVRLRTEETLRHHIDVLRRRADGDRISPDVLQGLCTSLGDTAAFIEEVEIQLGWSHSIPRDRGIDRMRQLALKLHATAQAKQPPIDP